MTTGHGSSAAHEPTPVPDLPKRSNGDSWYATLEDAIEAWSLKHDLHGENEVPQIYVYLHSHIGGWSVG